MKKILKRLGEQKAVALKSHAVGVSAVAVAIGTYAMANPDQMMALLGPKYGGILLAVAGAAVTIARLYKAPAPVTQEAPQLPEQENDTKDQL